MAIQQTLRDTGRWSEVKMEREVEARERFMSEVMSNA